GLFEAGVYLDEVGENAFGPQASHAALLDGGEEVLHRFGGVGAMGEDLLERFAAGFQAGHLGAESFGALAVDLGLLPGVREAGLQALAALIQGLELHLLLFQAAEGGSPLAGELFDLLARFGFLRLSTLRLAFQAGEELLDL